jgi:hypothetical protein
MPNDLFPAPPFVGCDIELELDRDFERLLRLALLSEAGLTLAELRAWEWLRSRMPMPS